MTILSGKYQFYYHCYFKGKETEAQRSKLLKIMWDKMCEHLDFTDSILSFFGYAVSRKKFLKLKTWAGGPQEEARLHLLPDSPPQAHHFNSCLNPLSCPFWPFVACGQAPRRTDRLLFAHWRLAACGRDPLRRWLRRTPWDSGWSGGPRGQGGAVDCRPPEASPRSPAGRGPGLEAAATLSPSSPLSPDGSGTAWASLWLSVSPSLGGLRSLGAGWVGHLAPSVTTAGQGLGTRPWGSCQLNLPPLNPRMETLEGKSHVLAP